MKLGKISTSSMWGRNSIGPPKIGQQKTWSKHPHIFSQLHSSPIWDRVYLPLPVVYIIQPNNP